MTAFRDKKLQGRKNGLNCKNKMGESKNETNTNRSALNVHVMKRSKCRENRPKDDVAATAEKVTH